MRCFSNINARKISSEWIWRGSFCRWESRGRVVTPIIRAAENIKKERAKLFPLNEIDEEKAESARIFSEKYYLAKNDEVYQQLMKEHKEKYESED